MAITLLQGCAQCADAMRGTPAGVQSAYRTAIVVMIVAGCSVFGAAVWLLTRDR